MSRSSKQRYRTNCHYFNFLCQPRGKYTLECGMPYYRKCPDLVCPAGLPPVQRRVTEPKMVPGVGE